ncbi:hypothetical protein GPALN_010776 [Globodera pallida]|nr:hypothetical protein GPALN_010776 [Globodera pallida]
MLVSATTFAKPYFNSKRHLFLKIQAILPFMLFRNSICTMLFYALLFGTSFILFNQTYAAAVENSKNFLLTINYEQLLAEFKALMKSGGIQENYNAVTDWALSKICKIIDETGNKNGVAFNGQIEFAKIEQMVNKICRQIVGQYSTDSMIILTNKELSIIQTLVLNGHRILDQMKLRECEMQNAKQKEALFKFGTAVKMLLDEFGVAKILRGGGNELVQLLETKAKKLLLQPSDVYALVLHKFTPFIVEENQKSDKNISKKCENYLEKNPKFSTRRMRRQNDVIHPFLIAFAFIVFCSNGGYGFLSIFLVCILALVSLCL